MTFQSYDTQRKITRAEAYAKNKMTESVMGKIEKWKDGKDISGGGDSSEVDKRIWGHNL